MGLTIDQLVDLYPRLFHMAITGAWPTIQQHGLLPTSHLVSTSDLSAEDQATLLERRRRTSTVIEHPIYGSVTIRDQAPLREDNLVNCLTDMTVVEWLRTLNDRVFFWLSPDRLNRLLGARLYRNGQHEVITIDTRSLVQAHFDNVRLSPINSGATIFPNAAKRGSATFRAIDHYPVSERGNGTKPTVAVTELAVIGGVPDLAEHVIRVDRYRGPAPIAQLYP